MNRNRLRAIVPSTVVALVFALGTLAPPLLAADAKQVSGKFTGKEWEFTANGAYAFPAPTGFDKEPGIKVAVASAGFLPEKLDVIWDREHLIDELYHQDGDLVVFFDFGKDGKFRGLSYYFGSGDGCGFCFDGGVRSDVKVAGGRIKGQIRSSATVEPGDAVFDVTFDVPIAPTDYGKPLAADGGAPGKAYAAYHQALVDASADALRPLLATADAETLKEHPDEMLSALRDDHPTASYRIAKAWSRADRALLLVAGETAYSKVDTEAHLVLVDGTWRVDQEILKVHLGD